jgi:hypothetical protein
VLFRYHEHVPEHVPDVHVLALPEHVPDVHVLALPEHVPDVHAVVAVVVAVELDVFATAPTTPKSDNATVATTKTAAIFLIPEVRFFLFLLGGASFSGDTSITKFIFAIPSPPFFLAGFCPASHNTLTGKSFCREDIYKVCFEFQLILSHSIAILSQFC